MRRSSENIDRNISYFRPKRTKYKCNYEPKLVSRYICSCPPSLACCRKHTSLTAASPAHFQRLSHTVVTNTFTYVFVLKPNVFVKQKNICQNLNIFITDNSFSRPSPGIVTTAFPLLTCIFLYLLHSLLFIKTYQLSISILGARLIIPPKQQIIWKSFPWEICPIGWY